MRRRIWMTLLAGIVLGSANTYAAEAAGVVRIRPSQDIAKVVARHPAGTTYRLASGSYRAKNIVLQDRDKVFGQGKRDTRINVSGDIGFNTVGRYVEIAYLSVGGAAGNKATCKGCGRGIDSGHDAYYHDLRSHHNASLGIGGHLEGALITDVEVDHNGSASYVGCCAGGIKSGTRFTARRVNAHDNIGNGLWCDMACSGLTRFINNRVVDNTLDGIHLEWSRNARGIVKRNTVRSSGRYGVQIQAYSKAFVRYNDIARSKKQGIAFNSGHRGIAAGVAEYNRTDGIRGCESEHVTCRKNR